MNGFAWQAYYPIRLGEIYETTINGIPIGKTVYSGLIDKRLEGVVLFSQNGEIKCYKVGDYTIGEDGLALRDAKEFLLSKDKEKMARNLLKQRGLI